MVPSGKATRAASRIAAILAKGRPRTSGDVAASAVVHWQPSIWPRSVIPGLEATVTAPFDGGDLEATLFPQALLGLTRGGHVALNLGAEFPLNDQSYDVRGYMYLIWDFADGSFFKGW